MELCIYGLIVIFMNVLNGKSVEEKKRESIWKEIIIKKKVNKDKKKKYIAFWGGGRLQVMIGHSCYKDKMV